MGNVRNGFLLKTLMPPPPSSSLSGFVLRYAFAVDCLSLSLDS
jgi:hypothetical protein